MAAKKSSRSGKRGNTPAKRAATARPVRPTPKQAVSPPRARTPAAANAKAPPAALSTARSTMSGPSMPVPGVPVDAPARKFAGTAVLAKAMPYNVNKAAEYGAASAEPPAGATVVPPDEEVGSSTLTETNASAKVGGGVPPVSFNPTVGPLTRVRVDSSRLTDWGSRVPFSTSSSSRT